MTSAVLEQRIRQLIAIEQNARDIFISLAKETEDPAAKKLFLETAGDEIKHARLEKTILEILAA